MLIIWAPPISRSRNILVALQKVYRSNRRGQLGGGSGVSEHFGGLLQKFPGGFYKK
jgi:hypothetical protein